MHHPQMTARYYKSYRGHFERRSFVLFFLGTMSPLRLVAKALPNRGKSFSKKENNHDCRCFWKQEPPAFYCKKRKEENNMIVIVKSTARPQEVEQLKKNLKQWDCRFIFRRAPTPP